MVVIKAHEVVVSLAAHEAGLDKLNVELAVAPEIHAWWLGCDPIGTPPIIAGIWQVAAFDFVPNPEGPEWPTELFADDALTFLEKNIGVFEEVSGVCSTGTGDVP